MIDIKLDFFFIGHIVVDRCDLIMYNILIDRIKVMGDFNEPVLLKSTGTRLEYELEAQDPNFTSIASIVVNLLGTKYSDELVDCKDSNTVTLLQKRIVIDNKVLNTFIEIIRISNIKYIAIIQLINKVEYDEFGLERLVY